MAAIVSSVSFRGFRTRTSLPSTEQLTMTQGSRIWETGDCRVVLRGNIWDLH